MWGQISDEIVTEIPPDGLTPVDVYASFEFSGEPVPEGTVVKFLVGKLKNGTLNEESNSDTTIVKKWTEEEIKSRIIAMEGVELSNYEAKIVNTVIRTSSSKLSVKPVAKTTIKPIGDVLKDSISVIAYCSYDKLSQVKRIIPDSISFTVSSGTGAFLATIDRYQISLNTWDQVEPMITDRTGPVSQFVGGKMYVIGGFNGNFVTNNEEFDPTTNKWAPKAPVPSPLAYSQSAVYNNCIYVFGGMNFSPTSISTSAYKYNPSTDEWTVLSSMPNPVAFGTCQVIGTKAYVISGASKMTVTTGSSGETENQTVDHFNFGIYSFDFSSETWETELPVVAGISTSLAVNISSGSEIIQVGSASVPPYGVLVINEGNATEEILPYDSYDGRSKFIKITSSTNYDHVSGETVRIINLPEARMSPNSRVVGTEVWVFNGKVFYGLNSKQSATTISPNLRKFDTIGKTFASVANPIPNVPRYKAADCLSSGSLTFILGGSNDASEWQNKVETFDGITFVGPTTYEKMPQSRTGLAAASYGDYVYVIGGNSSGHPAGWLQITAEAAPSSIRADGRETASVFITALDDAGDPPPDNTTFLARGIVYLQSIQKPAADQQQPNPTPRISILPVLFSSQEMKMIDGEASTVLLPRSEDPINQLAELAAGQITTDQGAKEKYQKANESRDLYEAAIEISVVDNYYFGSTDTDSAIADSKETNSPRTEFTFSPEVLKQGLSTRVSFFSDIVSVPDISVVSTDAVGSTEAKRLLDTIKEEIPFGASPYYDAMYRGIDLFSQQYDPLFPQKGMIIATLDNDESYSVYGPNDIIEAANTITGRRTYPIFATSFVITDPVSLSARRARTDVVALEKISFNTGGNSFSLIDETYIPFVIERIKTSAPSSFGSGRIVGTHEISGYLSSVRYNVSNLPSGNSAEMTISFSTDGYNFTELGVSIPPNTLYTLGSPILVSVVKYEVTLRSDDFDSPILTSVTLNYTQPNIQYLFTYPRQISGQISELDSVANYRLPSGGYGEGGFSHGESFMFDRDYTSIVQPAVRDRGTIMAINRSFDTLVEGSSTSDILRTNDYFVYRSISGNWISGSSITVYVNEEEIDRTEYIEIPEKGTIAFRKKLRPRDIVTVSVIPPSVFRYGLKLLNPSTETAGYLDSFAYEFATTQDEFGGQINRPPRAVNLFITPSPVQRGGPMTANYTFTDPDGDEEDTLQTKITWYRNNTPVAELQDKKTVLNNNFKEQRADSGDNYGIAKGQEWYFVVIPSDGKTFGSPSRSPKVVIAATPPTASNVYLASDNDDSTVFTSSDTISVIYEYSSADQANETNTIYTWFVNGLEIKSGNSSSLTPTEKDANDNKYLVASNAVRCEIIPSNGTEYGQVYSSDTVTITASPPSVKNVKIIPDIPTTLSTLRVQYDFADPDELTDRSIIYWYKNNVRMSELDNTTQVPSSTLSVGAEWYATVTPSNGLAEGTLKKSNVVVIEF